jgi:hypothetical protein
MALAGRGGEGAALTNAQSIVSGMVQSARSQAVLQQANTRLIIYYQQLPGPNTDSNKYLRALQIVRAEPLQTGATAWVAVGDPVILSGPICVVPTSPLPRDHLGLPTGQNWNNDIPTGPVSTLSVATGFSYSGQSPVNGRPGTGQFFGLQGQGGRVLYLEFGSDGTVVSPVATTPIKIAVATAVLTSGAYPKFNNANGVRGLQVRKTGAISLVNDATGF